MKVCVSQRAFSFKNILYVRTCFSFSSGIYFTRGVEIWCRSRKWWRYVSESLCARCHIRGCQVKGKYCHRCECVRRRTSRHWARGATRSCSKLQAWSFNSQRDLEDVKIQSVSSCARGSPAGSLNMRDLIPRHWLASHSCNEFSPVSGWRNSRTLAMHFCIILV